MPKKYIDADNTLATVDRAIENYAENDDVLEFLSEIRYAVIGQPAVDVEEVMRRAWISVEERVPEDVRDYLVVTDEGNIHKAVFTGDFWYNSDTTNKIRDGEVTHWMPLPEPPEVEG